MTTDTGRLARTLARDAALICIGSLIYAVGVDCFQVPNDLAAGGVTGLATVIRSLAADHGFNLPVGVQTLVMNALLMIPVLRSGGAKYASRSIAGIMASAFFTDLLAPCMPPLATNDLLLASLWGGLVSGLGLGLVFRSGGNTGGTDIVAQLISKRSGMPVGSLSIVCDLVVVIISVPVFSLNNALYAAVCMFVMGKVVDVVVDGPRTNRVAYIISARYDEIADEIMHELSRGCTKLEATGMWTGDERPVLFVILGRSEIGMLKEIVADYDPDAIVVISEVHEAFGEGFKQINDK